MANTIKNGVNTLSLNYTGKTARYVAQDCKFLLSMSGEEEMLINGRPVKPDQLINDGDTIEFRKAAGVKGASVMVTVQHGVNRVNVAIEDGSTVRQVLQAAASILGVDLNTGTPFLNGAASTFESRIHSGDRVECRKESGTKGAGVTVAVQYGVNRVSVTVEDGSTVRQVLQTAANILGANLTDGTPVLNGNPTTFDTCVRAGDRVECRKASGTKGC